VVATLMTKLTLMADGCAGADYDADERPSWNGPNGGGGCDVPVMTSLAVTVVVVLMTALTGVATTLMTALPGTWR
jgi:hypothetical protein